MRPWTNLNGLMQVNSSEAITASCPRARASELSVPRVWILHCSKQACGLTNLFFIEAHGPKASLDTYPDDLWLFRVSQGMQSRQGMCKVSEAMRDREDSFLMQTKGAIKSARLFP
jgi:hypothetical protein